MPNNQSIIDAIEDIIDNFSHSDWESYADGTELRAILKVKNDFSVLTHLTNSQLSSFLLMINDLLGDLEGWSVYDSTLETIENCSVYDTNIDTIILRT